MTKIRAVGLSVFMQFAEDVRNKFKSNLSQVRELEQKVEDLQEQVQALLENREVRVTVEAEPYAIDVLPKPTEFLGEQLINKVTGKIKSVDKDYIILHDGEAEKQVPSGPYMCSHGFADMSVGMTVTLAQYKESPPDIEFHTFN